MSISYADYKKTILM